MRVSLSGPWGIDKLPTQLRCHIDFPATYPNDATPIVAIDKAFSLKDQTIQAILAEVVELANSFLNQKRHSLEAILRYLLGEQSLDESLQWLRGHGTHEESTTDIDLVASSSSDEDDNSLAHYVPPAANGLESSDSMIAVNNTGHNVPLRRTCGALWCGNGHLTCFFPKKQEKEASLLGQSFVIDACLQKSGKDLFEGFGRLHKAYRQKYASSMLEMKNDGDSNDEYDLISSDSSSSSDDGVFPSHHFMPMVPWDTLLTGTNPEETLDASQKSVGDTAQPSTTASKGSVTVSVKDFSDLLPVKEQLARRYIVESGYDAALYNAAVAREYGNSDQVDAWNYAALLLHQQSPDQPFPTSGRSTSTPTAVHSSFPSLALEDSAIDLSFDLEDEQTVPFTPLHVEWKSQNFGRQWLSQSLYIFPSAISAPELTLLRLDHFEAHGDVQMLAMLTCVLSPPLDLLQPTDENEAIIPEMYALHEPQGKIHSKDQSSPEGRERKLLGSSETKMFLQENLDNFPKEPDSATSSIGFVSSDPSSLLAGGATPPRSKPFRISHDSPHPHAASLSISPDRYPTIQRTASDSSSLNAPYSRPLQFHSFAISPPLDGDLRKRPSPTGSYLSPHMRTTWTPSSWIHQITSNAEEPKSSAANSIHDVEGTKPAVLPFKGFSCTMKNQDQFHGSSSSNAPLLGPNQDSKYHCWREAYASMLRVWDMPLEAAEVMKFSRHFLTTKAETFALNQPALLDAKLLPKELSLELAIHCQHCATLSPSTSSDKCPSCYIRLLQKPLCIYCNTYVLGLASPCLNCGHVMHVTCRTAFLDSSSDASEDDDDGIFEGSECITGCGCICADYDTVEVSMPAKATRPSAAFLRKASSIRKSNSPPASTLNANGGTERRDDDYTYRRNSNLEVGGAHGIETAGSAREENEDAYVKLRKSLKGQVKRKGSATSASKGLRASASQIWRGS